MNLGEVNKPLGPPGGGGGAALAPVEAADGLRRPLGLRSGEKCVVWAPLSGHGHLVQNQRFSDQPVTAVALTLEAARCSATLASRQLAISAPTGRITKVMLRVPHSRRWRAVRGRG